MSGRDHLRDGAAIYERSFAIIRDEANLSRLSPPETEVAVRMIHACGMVEIADDLVFHPDFCRAAIAALTAGKAIFCDAKMVTEGITRARLPAANPVICTLAAPGIAALAARRGTTRSAAALDLWGEALGGEALGGEALGGALVVIGNAPTALFRLLEYLDAGAPAPAAVIGMPVGFVGAAESKTALAEDGRVPFLVLPGRRGGSAMAAAAVNALAGLAWR
jgi:precorrin-8X/cobalt-precorrin-8 methylmutase